jgi:predicted enzyme related to lactoylglutathione lyase
VTGIGGIFFFSDNPDQIKAWYAENLGLEVNEWGSSFEFRNANRPAEINYLQWSPFQHGSEYFAPSKKEFMINYRVQNIDGLVKKLRTNGVTIVDEIETFEYGKFVHIMDSEGNKIELWEPVEKHLQIWEERQLSKISHNFDKTERGPSDSCPDNSSAVDAFSGNYCPVAGRALDALTE